MSSGIRNYDLISEEYLISIRHHVLSLNYATLGHMTLNTLPFSAKVHACRVLWISYHPSLSTRKVAPSDKFGSFHVSEAIIPAESRIIPLRNHRTLCSSFPRLSNQNLPLFRLEVVKFAAKFPFFQSRTNVRAFLRPTALISWFMDTIYLLSCSMPVAVSRKYALLSQNL